MKKGTVTIVVTSIVTVVMLAWLMSGGCTEQPNPDTGQPEMVIAPGTVIAIDAATEVAGPLAVLLAIFFPALYPAIGLVTGAVGTWANMKGKITKATTKIDVVETTLVAVVTAIEQWKIDNPDDWEKLGDKLEGNMGVKTEAAIREIRGLPLKD